MKWVKELKSLPKEELWQESKTYWNIVAKLAKRHKYLCSKNQYYCNEAAYLRFHLRKLGCAY